MRYPTFEIIFSVVLFGFCGKIVAQNPPPSGEQFDVDHPSVVQTTETQASMADNQKEVQLVSELRAIWSGPTTPQEKVAQIEARLRDVPLAPVSEARPRESAPKRLAFVPNQALSENDVLIQDAVVAIDEIREATSRNPEKQVAFVDEFLRLNAGTLADIRSRGNDEAKVGVSIPTEGGDSGPHKFQQSSGVEAEVSQTVWELRQQARTSEESVRLVDEFLQLNREIIKASRQSNLLKGTTDIAK
jgi:hypothetical protein